MVRNCISVLVGITLAAVYISHFSGFSKFILARVCVSHSFMYSLRLPWTVACQAPLSMGFSRQEYWSGLPVPSPRNLPCPGIEPRSPALQADSLPSVPSLAHATVQLRVPR